VLSPQKKDGKAKQNRPYRVKQKVCTNFSYLYKKGRKSFIQVDALLPGRKGILTSFLAGRKEREEKFYLRNKTTRSPKREGRFLPTKDGKPCRSSPMIAGKKKED